MVATFGAASLMRSPSAASTGVRRVLKTGEGGLVIPETIWCITGTKMGLSMATVYLGAESAVHGYGTGDANQEISGPENHL